jgi:hypothetical protein
MPKSNVPFLCGGIFFALLMDAKMRTSAKDHRSRKTDSMTDGKAFARLISIFHLREYTAGGEESLRKNASAFKNCKDSLLSFTEFSDQGLVDAFDHDVRKGHEAWDMTEKLVTDLIDETKFKPLARNLLGLIHEDTSIPEDTTFYLGPLSLTKSELTGCKQISLPSLILSIWHFVIMNRASDNLKGADTYRYCFPEKYCCYQGHFNETITNDIVVTMENPFDADVSTEYNQEGHDNQDRNNTTDMQQTNIVNGNMFQQNGNQIINMNVNGPMTLNL